MKSDTGPFSLIPEWVMDAEITPRAIQLYVVLGRYADSEGLSWPSRATLAARMRCSSDVVDRAKQELLDLGALEWEQRRGADGVLTSNFYKLIRAAPVRLGTRESAARGSRESAAENENHLEREPSLAPDKPTRARDLLFETLCEVTDTAWSELTDRSRGPFNAVVRDLKSLGVTPDELRARAGAYRRKYPNAVLTASALGKHWASLGNGRTPVAAAPALTAEQRAELWKELDA